MGGWAYYSSDPEKLAAYNERRRERRNRNRKPSKTYLRELKKHKKWKAELKKIEKENRRLFRVGLHKAIDKINRMRQSRMIRLKDQCLSYKQRVLLAIDYYYELVRQNTMKAA